MCCWRIGKNCDIDSDDSDGDGDVHERALLANQDNSLTPWPSWNSAAGPPILLSLLTNVLEHRFTYIHKY